MKENSFIFLPANAKAHGKQGSNNDTEIAPKTPAIGSTIPLNCPYLNKQIKKVRFGFLLFAHYKHWRIQDSCQLTLTKMTYVN